MNAAGSLYFADEGYLTWQKNLVELHQAMPEVCLFSQL